MVQKVKEKEKLKELKLWDSKSSPDMKNHLNPIIDIKLKPTLIKDEIGDISHHSSISSKPD